MDGFRISAKLKSKNADVFSFRMMVASKLKHAKVAPYGTCTREGDRVEVDFFLLSANELAVCRGVLLEVVSELSEFIDPAFKAVEAVKADIGQLRPTRCDPTTLVLWAYNPAPSSPGDGPYVPPQGATTRKRAAPVLSSPKPAKLPSSQSSGDQEAHVLFQKARQSDMLEVLTALGVEEGEREGASEGGVWAHTATALCHPPGL